MRVVAEFWHKPEEDYLKKNKKFRHLKLTNPKGTWNPYFLTIRNSLVPGSRLTFLLFSLQWFPFHFSPISMLHISPLCVSPLFELERTPPPPSPRSSALPNKPSEIPWLTAVPDGIITPRFHSQLAQDPPPAEVAVPPPCPRVNINTNIWRCYVILYLWGDMLRWSPNKFSFIFVVVQFHKSWVQGLLSFQQYFMYAHAEMHCRWQSFELKVKVRKPQNWLSLKIQSTCDEGRRWYRDCAFIKVHSGLCQCFCFCILCSRMDLYSRGPVHRLWSVKVVEFPL